MPCIESTQISLNDTNFYYIKKLNSVFKNMIDELTYNLKVSLFLLSFFCYTLFFSLHFCFALLPSMLIHSVLISLTSGYSSLQSSKLRGFIHIFNRLQKFYLERHVSISLLNYFSLIFSKKLFLYLFYQF